MVRLDGLGKPSRLPSITRAQLLFPRLSISPLCSLQRYFIRRNMRRSSVFFRDKAAAWVVIIIVLYHGVRRRQAIFRLADLY